MNFESLSSNDKLSDDDALQSISAGRIGPLFSCLCLVHISELSSRYVKDINDCVKKGDNVKVKVIKIDESGKISLSMKQAEEKKERAPISGNILLLFFNNSI